MLLSYLPWPPLQDIPLHIYLTDGLKDPQVLYVHLLCLKALQLLNTHTL